MDRKRTLNLFLITTECKGYLIYKDSNQAIKKAKCSNWGLGHQRTIPSFEPIRICIYSMFEFSHNYDRISANIDETHIQST